jgi:hypothetical protein
MAKALRRRGLRAALAVAALGTATLVLGSTPALAAASTVTNTATGGATGAATRAAGIDCTAPVCVQVFNTDGTLFADALVDPATGQVVLLDPTSGVIIGIVAEEGSTVVVIGASGAVIGTLGLDEATDQVVFAPV